uniref:Uncharacterized protein n=1 Tax=Caenorhabditis japonica TaxID=281687 RepID=A0A8R1IJT4_CAEJA
MPKRQNMRTEDTQCFNLSRAFRPLLSGSSPPDNAPLSQQVSLSPSFAFTIQTEPNQTKPQSFFASSIR